MTTTRHGLEIPLLDTEAARSYVLVAATVSVALIAFVDWKVKPNVSLGFLYLFPIVAVSLFARRWQIGLAALLCGVLREALSPLPWDGEGLTRLLMVFAAFLGTGLAVSELARNRRQALEHAARLKQEGELREEAREEVRVLVESSPAAIFTLDADGRVLLANEAAHRLFAFEDERLQGASLRPLLPTLVAALESPRPLLRTSMESVGRRRDGEVFLAHAWFSTYWTRDGLRLAAIVLDASDQLRDREALGLGSVASASRVLFAAVSHEVRNLAAAAAVAHANLARTTALPGNQDFEALGALVAGLERIASARLRLGGSATVQRTDLRDVLDELRIVLEPGFREDGMALEWRIPDALPQVLAEPHSLLQIFLNLAQNSQREMACSPDPRVLAVVATVAPEAVEVRFQDTGPGVARPELLFRPFPRDGEATGLGLFVSRHIARSFAGDVRHEPTGAGSCFVVRLSRADGPGEPR